MPFIQITVNNTDIGDAFVKVNDQNQPGAPEVFNARVNASSASFPFGVQPDGNGNFSIGWVATNANDPGESNGGPGAGSASDSVPVHYT